jgi:hypothetical protein
MAVITQDEVKTLLQITDSSKDDLIDMLIPIVEADITKECNVLPTEAGVKIPASMMIGYLMNKWQNGGASLGISSESQGGYSYVSTSEFGNNTGYPASITGMLKKYKIIKPHFGSIMQSSRDRRGMTPAQLATDVYVPGVDQELMNEDN